MNTYHRSLTTKAGTHCNYAQY
uniref:Uncharacterized protein n=1 Tax=Rhizophora mucronata TaxID=61149 RepID=A0A2P2PKN3_RHIMU